MFRWDYRVVTVGDVIPPGGFGQELLRIGPGHPLWRREIMLEWVRVMQFATRPCRLSGLMAFPDEHHERLNADAVMSRSGTHYLYAVESLADARVHYAPEQELAEVTQQLRERPPDVRAAVRAAQAYWRGVGPAESTEVVSSGGLRVVRLVDTRQHTDSNPHGPA